MSEIQAIPVRPDRDSAISVLSEVKTRQQRAWSAGDYAVVGTTLQIVGEQLCEALDVRSGQRILDVAAGNGNVSLAAARRGCQVTSTDYVPALLERGRERALAERLAIEFQEADAEMLPFQEGSFDAVTSAFGVMFTPDQARAAAELIRTCRSGGSIGLANWTPDGFIGQLFGVIGKYLPPPAGVRSPSCWGTRAWIEDIFAPDATRVQAECRVFMFRYRSAEHWLDVFRTYYGPILKAYDALAADTQLDLTGDLLALVNRFNRAVDGTMVVPSEYLEVVITKK